MANNLSRPAPFTVALLLAVLSLAGFGTPSQGTPAARAAAPPADRRTAKRLLIVAPTRFHAALGEFVRHKRRQLPTELRSLETVLRDTSGVDDPERLKRYLYSAWRDRNLGYVLLVGDVDVLPVRYMVLDRITKPAFDVAFYPSDLYYSDLAGRAGQLDDWNGRRDGFHAGYFGEVRGEKNKSDPINFDRIDYRPEVAVGRWPVSDAAEVRQVAAKTIAYETGVARGAHPGARRAALFSVDGWVDSRGTMDSAAAALPSAWRSEKRYYADAGRDDHTPSPDEAQLRTLLNEGLGLVVHAGHGTDDTWEGCFARARLDRVKNRDRLPVMVSAGCSTARFATLPPYEPYVDVNGREHPGTNHGEVFDAPPPPPAPYQKGRFNPMGLGEQLLRGGPDGAVAYIGCNTGSQPCGLTLLEGFASALGRAPEPRLGDCWAGAVAHYYEAEKLATLKPTEDWYPASIFFQGMKFMLFGDPSLRMPEGQ